MHDQSYIYGLQDRITYDFWDFEHVEGNKLDLLQESNFHEFLQFYTIHCSSRRDLA